MELPTAIEGKAALFKRFGGTDAWPVVLDTKDTDLIVEIVHGGARAGTTGGPRNLEYLCDP